MRLKFTAKISKVCQLVAAAGAAVLMGVQPMYAADKLTLKLDWLPSGYHAPLFLGLEKGYYSAAGIDLKIEDGQGTNPALQAAAAGNADIVVANYSTMMQSIASGMDLIGIAGLIQKLPDSVISLAKDPITSPKQLEGRTVAVTTDSAGSKLIVAYMKAAGIDASKVTVLGMKAGQETQALLGGGASAMTGWSFTNAVTVAQQAPIATPLMFADEGINILGNGFITTKTFEAKNKDLIQRFITATAKSYAEGIKNPDAAVDAMIKARPLVEKPLQLAQLQRMEPLMHTTRTAGKPFGWTAKEDWEQSQDLLQKYFSMQGSVNVSSVYTNAYTEAK